MQTEVTVRDQVSFNPRQGDHIFTLHFPADQITIRELIQTRICQEVQTYNTHHPSLFCGLVQPTNTESVLNSFRLPKPRFIDWEKQFDKAITSFLGNGFIILINDRQVEALDEMIEITPKTQVTFLKLMPLVGG